LLIGEIGESANASRTVTNNKYPLWFGGNDSGGGCGGPPSAALRIGNANYFINMPKTHALYASNSDSCFGSFHPNGAQFVLLDGSVRLLTNQINTTMYGYLMNRGDGNAVSID